MLSIRLLLCLVLTTSLNVVNSAPQKGQDSPKCGYDSCPDLSDDLIHVHLVPHTHDDVGWLKNPDEYFYGDKDNIQRADVRYLIDNVVDELLKDETRRFIYVEMYFFSRWWDIQSESRKQDVRMLVDNGRLVFINGGWTMNDEAATHYNAIIDQMTLGMRFLNTTFGNCGIPRVSWHIDPFGHSKENAHLFAMMGFDSFFFARLDHDDKNNRLQTKRMEELWKAGNADLFFGAFYGFYGPPSGFCFDGVDCTDTPIKDDKDLEDYNVDERIDDFLGYVEQHAAHYKTNHIIVPMGSDFQYMMANKWYTNLDKLIKYANERQVKGSKINLLYSTPMCYTKSLNDAKVTWTTKSDDFFPYSSDYESYWTGYFTSRPVQKGYIREMNNLLQAGKQLVALTKSPSTIGVSVLEEAVATNQHHDAVTGTEKQAVQNDYMRRLSKGMVLAQTDIADIFDIPSPDFCPYRNISICTTSENEDNFLVTLYNPLARQVSHYVRMPVHGKSYLISDSNGNIVVGDVMPVPGSLYAVRRNRGNAPFELTFKATIDGLSAVTYTIQKNASHISAKLAAKELSESTVLDPYFQTFAWYHASKGDLFEPASGAYCFRPQEQTPNQIKPTHSETFYGKLVTETRWNFTESWISVVHRKMEGKPYIESEWIVGPIPVHDEIAKEIITQYNTHILNQDTFYTDSNGRQILQRVKDYRPTWDFVSSEPVSQNYYPINSRIYIRDEYSNSQVTIVNDRSQGGTSMNDGQIEVMLHRRDLADDGFGVGEALNEPGQFGDGLIVRGKHWILNTTISESAKAHRLAAEEMMLKPIVIFHTVNGNPGQFLKGITLPENVHLLTLQEIDANPNRLLVRLEHQFAEQEDINLSKPVTVNIKEMFGTMLNPISVRAMTLAGDKYADETSRFTWKSTSGDSVDPDWTISGFDVTLKPMEIKTIEVMVESDNQEF